MFGIDSALMIGGSLLSGIFGSKKKKEKTTINYSEMAASAEAAGFNPLTALRNGGSAGFTTTVSHPGLSAMGDAISAIGGHLGTKLNQKVDPIEAKRQKVDDLLLDYQLAALQSQKKQVTPLGGVPLKVGSPESIQLRPRLSSRPAAPAAAIASSKSPAANWFTPPAPTKDALPIWVPGVDRDGKQVWIPNPDGPDIEQLAFGAAIRTQAEMEKGYGSAFEALANPSRHIRTRKLTQKEQPTGWRSYIPQFSFSWEETNDPAPLSRKKGSRQPLSVGK